MTQPTILVTGATGNTGGATETPVLGDAEEGLDTIERALPDCEVLLHGPSTLSRIVARR